MGLPTSFFGILAFIILVGYLIVDVMDKNNSSNEVFTSINSMQSGMNQSLNDAESSSGLSGFFNMLGSIIDFGWSIVLVGFNSITSFLTIPTQRGLPQEIFVVFSLIIVGFVVAIVKWIWSGE